MNTIIYVMDVQCGWCYGNSDNISKLQERFKDDYTFEIRTGGMWLNDKAPVGGDELSQFLRVNGQKMSSVTGAELSDEFFKLANDSSYVFSSLEPNAAICLVKQLAPEKVFIFVKMIQKELYIGGKRLDKIETYLPVLNELCIDIDAFKIQWLSDNNLSDTQKDFIEAGKYVDSFPTLLRQVGEKIEIIAIGYFIYEDIVARLISD